eukprot:5824401-Prymnesium_polylepis.1
MPISLHLPLRRACALCSLLDQKPKRRGLEGEAQLGGRAGRRRVGELPTTSSACVRREARVRAYGWQDERGGARGSRRRSPARGAPV